MKRLAVALLLLAAPVQARWLQDCTVYYVVRLTYEWAPGDWQTLDVGPMVTVKGEADEQRRLIEREGWTWPSLIPEQESEIHITAGAIKRASVKKLCCHQVGPPSDWWCRYEPGTEPPPAP